MAVSLYWLSTHGPSKHPPSPQGDPPKDYPYKDRCKAWTQLTAKGISGALWSANHERREDEWMPKRDPLIRYHHDHQVQRAVHEPGSWPQNWSSRPSCVGSEALKECLRTDTDTCIASPSRGAWCPPTASRECAENWEPWSTHPFVTSYGSDLAQGRVGQRLQSSIGAAFAVLTPVIRPTQGPCPRKAAVWRAAIVSAISAPTTMGACFT